VLDRLARYQTVASANQVYDDEARKKLMDKINRMAANFGVDEVMYAAAQEHLKKLEEIVDEPGQADGDGADMASQTERELFCPETATGSDYLSLNPS
jgi:hypothetical protein